MDNCEKQKHSIKMQWLFFIIRTFQPGNFQHHVFWSFQGLKCSRSWLRNLWLTSPGLKLALGWKFRGWNILQPRIQRSKAFYGLTHKKERKEIVKWNSDSRIWIEVIEEAKILFFHLFFHSVSNWVIFKNKPSVKTCMYYLNQKLYCFWA